MWDIEIVTTGSVWRSECKIHERFSKLIVNQYPQARIIFPRHEPAYGAGLLAWQKLTNVEC